MEQSPSSTTNTSSAAEEFSYILWNPKFHNGFLKNQSSVRILNQVNPVHSRPTDCLNIDKIQQDATVCRYIFTAKSLYMFRVSIAHIFRST